MSIFKRNTVMDMTEGSPFKLIIAFSVPLILGNIFQQLYTIVDTMVVGQTLGVTALAALGTIDVANWLSTGLILGFTQGFGILIAQVFGSKDNDKLNKTINTSIILSAIIALIMLVLIQLLIVPLLILLRVPDEIRPLSVMYLRIIIAGLPIVMAYNMEAVILRSLGDSRSPFVAMIIATCTNVTLDILFVVVLGYGIPGAAVATLIAQLISAIFCGYRISKISILHILKGKNYFEKDLSSQMFRLGVPLALNNMVISLGGMVLQSIIDGFGVSVIAASTATNKLYGILNCAALAYGYAMTTYVGQNYGAGNLKRIQKGVAWSVIISFFSCIIIASIAIIFGKNMLNLFISGTPEEMSVTLEYAYRFLCDLSYFLFSLYIIHLIRNILQGMGHTVLSMSSGFVELGIRIIVALTLPVIYGPRYLFFAHTLAWVGSDIILIIGYFYYINKYKAEANIQ